MIDSWGTVHFVSVLRIDFNAKDVYEVPMLYHQNILKQMSNFILIPGGMGRGGALTIE